MGLLTVNKETCTKCGLCASVCPGRIVYYREGRYPRLLPNTNDYCIRCGHCVAICPTASMSHAELPGEGIPDAETEHDITFPQVAQLIMMRRSIREFKDNRVPREKIQRIIDVARYAPTGHNNQEVRWHVITDREVVKTLSDIGTVWLKSMIDANPAFQEMFGGALQAQLAGNDVFLREALVVVTVYAEENSPMAATDCAAALGYFDLAATSAGLGCCWAGFFYMSAATFPAMKKAVSIPEGFTPYGSLMVGYPKYTYQRMPFRKPADIIWQP